MNKRNTTLFALMVIVVFSILFVPSCSSEKTATLASTPLTKELLTATQDMPTQLVSDLPTVTQTIPVPSISRDALQKYASADIETQTVNGIEMSVSNFRISGRLLEVDACFTAPNNKEWTIGEGFAQIGDKKIRLLGAKNLEISETLDDGTGRIIIISGKDINVEKVNYSVPNYRCDTLSFLLNTEQMVHTREVSLTVKNIHFAINEGHVCAPVEMAQSIMDEKNLGIKVACTQIDSNGLSSADIKILERPQNMSEEQAQQYISEAARQATFIDGPWVFEGAVTVVQNP